MAIKEVEQRISNYLILFEGKELTRKQTIAKIIHIPVSEGKMCDACKGEGTILKIPNRKFHCPKCHGTGKLPPVTVEKVIEDYLNATL